MIADVSTPLQKNWAPLLFVHGYKNQEIYVIEIHEIYEIEIDMTQKYYYMYENTKCGSTTVSLLYILIMDMIFLVSFSMTE